MLVPLNDEFPKLRPVMDAAKNRRSTISRVDSNIRTEGDSPLFDKLDVPDGYSVLLRACPGPSRQDKLVFIQTETRPPERAVFESNSGINYRLF